MKYTIQRKRQTCSKRAPYLDNISWPESPEFDVCLCYIHLNGILLFLQFQIFYWRFWESLVMVERERWIALFVSFFKKATEIPSPKCKTHWILEMFYKSLLTMVEFRRKFRFFKMSKMSKSPWECIIFKKLT